MAECQRMYELLFDEQNLRLANRTLAPILLVVPLSPLAAHA